MRTLEPRPSVARRKHFPVAADEILLACGILYAGTYVVANDGIAASLYHGYSRINQAVSELSAKGASSRPFLVGMFVVWTPAMLAFGLGVWRAARGSRALRATGIFLIASGVTSVVWLPFPMTARENMVPGSTSTNDVGHLVMSAVTVLLILAQVVASAFAFGKRFRLYSMASAAVVLVAGGLMARLAPNVPNGKPTPWMGLYERASIGAWLLWMTVLAVVLIVQHRRASLTWSEGPDTPLPAA